MALKYMSGTFPTTPYKTLDYFINTPNIIDFLHDEAAKGAVRLIGYGDWTVDT